MKRDTADDDKDAIRTIISHYKKHGRHDLVWRKDISGYRIFVSEVMLQQTQVSRVLPKFETWMKKYPTLRKLKEATLKDVLILWQGLGYQRRAKALLEVAKKVQMLPKSYDELVALPGIGPYTASAICAFAYDKWSRPPLETNIRTALIELFHPGETEIHDGMLYDDLSRLEGYGSVQKMGARNWYYALMDYGAHLKANRISHNKKSLHHRPQTPYKGSLRELRAKALFAIAHHKVLPADERLQDVIDALLKERFIEKKGKGYSIL